MGASIFFIFVKRARRRIEAILTPSGTGTGTSTGQPGTAISSRNVRWAGFSKPSVTSTRNEIKHTVQISLTLLPWMGAHAESPVAIDRVVVTTMENGGWRRGAKVWGDEIGGSAGR